MNQALEERMLRYVKSIQEEHIPEERTWWQHLPPVYHDTKEYAANYDKAVNTDEPAVFKKQKKEWVIASVMLLVATILLYLLSKNEFGFVSLLLLGLLLLIILPRLLDNRTMIRVGRESIWLYKENKGIRWDHVILTYIKEVREESVSYFFIIHYYDESRDDFNGIEIDLKGMAEPTVLAATIETFREKSGSRLRE